MVTIQIPKLGVAMTEGTLVEWAVADGETVGVGQVLYRLETDKVENEVESPAAGTIRLVAAPGETYPVGTVVAEIG
jgi:pyruvate/2-oxoglutarate dehydrogenase complex dihydrolipoamide acyltransferase (E2) component